LTRSFRRTLQYLYKSKTPGRGYFVAGVFCVSDGSGAISGGADAVAGLGWPDALDAGTNEAGLIGGIVVLAAGGNGGGMNNGAFWPQAASNCDNVSVTATIPVREK